MYDYKIKYCCILVFSLYIFFFSFFCIRLSLILTVTIIIIIIEFVGSMASYQKLDKESAEKREKKLQKDHEVFISSIATMRSLPQLRSTIAGAGGKTNESVRIAEEKERMRLKRMRDEASAEETRRVAVEAHLEKVNHLKVMQEKKRLKRLKKKAANSSNDKNFLSSLGSQESE